MEFLYLILKGYVILINLVIPILEYPLYILKVLRIDILFNFFIRALCNLLSNFYILTWQLHLILY